MVRLGVGLCKRLGIGLEARDKVRGWAGDRLEALGVGCSPAAGRRGRACSAISPLYLRYISAISPLYLLREGGEVTLARLRGRRQRRQLLRLGRVLGG